MLCTATGFQLSKMIDPKSGGWEINLDQISGFSPPLEPSLYHVFATKILLNITWT